MDVKKFILKSAYPFRYYIFGAFLVILFYAIDASLRPYLIKLLINSASSSQLKEASELWLITFYFIILQFLVPISWRFYDWCSMRYESALKNYIVTSIIEHASKHDYLFFQTHYTGSLVAKITDLRNFIPAIIATIINQYVLNILSITVGMFMLWYVHPWFALGIFLWSSLMIGISASTISQFNFLSNQTAEAVSKIIGNIVDFLGNILSVKLFSARSYELERLDKVQEEYLIASRRRRWFLLKLYSAQGISFSIYQMICLLLLVYLWSQGKVTPGDFAMILTFNLFIIDGLWQMSDKMREFSENWGAADQALKTFYVPLKVKDKPDAKELVVTQGKIVFENVQFHYKDMEALFERKSVTIYPGQKVGLVGYSGSGKSTFVNLILRLFDLNSGRILIDDQDISQVTQDSLRAAIGMIPQDPFLFHRSIMENIRYGSLEATDDEIIEAAKKAHAHEFIEKLSKKYETLVGERGAKLSGGQRQRIAIARAILKNAPILMLDEATSQLDSVTEQYIQESLNELMKGKTTIVIAHRLSTLLNMDRILVFDYGKIVEDGTHQTLLAKGGLYKILWEAQIGGFLIDEDLIEEESEKD